MNIFYTQLFINYLGAKNPRRIKFFDEAGIPDVHVGTSRLNGHCVEVTRKAESRNATLNMLQLVAKILETFSLIRVQTVALWSCAFDSPYPPYQSC